MSFTRDVLGQDRHGRFDLVLTFVLSVYLLVYAKDIGTLARRIVPPGDGTPEDDFPLLIQRAVAGYVRGQLLFSLIMGVERRRSRCGSSGLSASSRTASATRCSSASSTG